MTLIKPEQKVIYYKLYNASVIAIEKELNNYGSEGWEVSMVTPTIYRGGGAFLTVGHGYHINIYLLVLNKTGGKYSYKCAFLKQQNNYYPGYIEEINKEISSQNEKGFKLIHLMPCSSIDPEMNSNGTKFCIAIFMRKIRSYNRKLGKSKRRIVSSVKETSGTT